MAAIYPNEYNTTFVSSSSTQPRHYPKVSFYYERNAGSPKTKSVKEEREELIFDPKELDI